VQYFDINNFPNIGDAHIYVFISLHTEKHFRGLCKVITTAIAAASVAFSYT
jgi:hypothetical protein